MRGRTDYDGNLILYRNRRYTAAHNYWLCIPDSEEYLATIMAAGDLVRQWKDKDVPPLVTEILTVLDICEKHPVYGERIDYSSMRRNDEYELNAAFVDGLIERGEI